MTKNIPPALLAILLCAASLHAQEQIAVVRKDGLLVLMPQVDGSGTYGTYLVPNALGRESTDRFVYLGNPVQINFLPPSEFSPDFPRMTNRQKLAEFFRSEGRYLSESTGQNVEFAGLKPSRAANVDYLSGTAIFLAPNGQRIELRIKARAAGNGILHAGYQATKRATFGKAQSMVDRLLRSFTLIRRPLTQEEIDAISRQARS